MIQEIYIRDNSINYMTIESDEKPGEENYQIKMLLKNSVARFLPVSIRVLNNRQIYYYDISSKQPLSRMYEGKNIKKDDVKNIVMHISRISEIIGEYLLDLDCVVLNARFMYMNISDRSLHFTYYPHGGRTFGESLRELFEFILEHLDHNDKKAVIITYGIYQKILQNDYDLQNLAEDMEEELYEEKDSTSSQVQRGNSGEKIKEFSGDSLNANERPDKNFGEDKNAKVKYPGNKHIIESVIPETVMEEKEINNTVIAAAFIVAKIFFAIVGTFTAFNIFFTEYRLIKLDFVPGVIVIVLAIVAYKLVNIIYEKNRMCFTRIVRDSEKMEYEVSEQEIYVGPEEKSAPVQKTSVPVQKSSVIAKPDDYAQTQLLSDYLKEADTKVNCRLVAEDEYAEEKEIVIRENPFIIGSLPVNCNFSIESKLVSRMHVRLTREVGSRGYFVEDLNSTNGTYVNGGRIEPNQKVQISDGDMLKIAVMQYRFWTE